MACRFNLVCLDPESARVLSFIEKLTASLLPSEIVLSQRLSVVILNSTGMQRTE